MCNSPRAKLLATSIATLMSASSIAATEETELESLVVVGKTTNISLSDDDLVRLQADDLADIFELDPAVSVGGSLGLAQKIYVRGLEDTLLNVTVDGAPQTSTLFHHIGRVNIDPELLRQVEVVAGAGEATNGAGAIGGAIRFETKDAQDLLKPGENFGALIKGAAYSNNGDKKSVSLFGRLGENWGVLLSHVAKEQDNFKDGNGDEVLGTAAEQELSFVKLSGDIGSAQRLSLSVEKREESGNFSQRPNWAMTVGDPLFPATAERLTSVLNYQFAASQLLDLELTLYSTSSELQQNVIGRWGLYGAEVKSYGFDLRNNTELGKHAMTYGIEYRSDEVSSRYLEDVSVWGGFAWDPAVGSYKEEGKISSLYWQDHYQISEQLLLSFGLRYDDYEVEQITYDGKNSDDGISPNIGIEYELTSDWTLHAGIAQAIRGKEVGDAFTLEQRPGRIAFAPDLQAEQATNSELGLSYDNGPMVASVTLYKTEIDDVLFDQIGSGPAPQNGVYYENIGVLEIQGVELKFAYEWDKTELALAYSKNDIELNGHDVEAYEHNGLANLGGDNLQMQLVFEPEHGLELGWQLIYVEDANNIEVLHRGVELGWIDELQSVDKPGYTLHNVFMQWSPDVKPDLTFNLTVKNLFNKQYRSHASVADYSHISGWEGVVGLNEAGRDLRLGVSYQF